MPTFILPGSAGRCGASAVVRRRRHGALQSRVSALRRPLNCTDVTGDGVLWIRERFYPSTWAVLILEPRARRALLEIAALSLCDWQRQSSACAAPLDASWSRHRATRSAPARCDRHVSPGTAGRSVGHVLHPRVRRAKAQFLLRAPV